MLKEKKVLIIDNSSFMRLQVKNVLEKEGFVVSELTNVEDYFSASWQYKDVGVVILEENLPGMDGVAALGKMNSQKTVGWPPVIMLSGCSDKNIIRTTLALGAKYYILKPLVNEVFIQRVNHLFDCPPPKKFEQQYFELTAIVKDTIAKYVKCDFEDFPIDAAIDVLNECLELVNREEKMILFNNIGADMDGYSFRHTLNVAMLSGVIGKWVGLKEKDVRELVLAGLLHDLGKVKISEELLLKTGELTVAERKILNTHVVHSYNLINNEGFSKEVLLGVLQHHERMDGSGYPRGILGREICMTARIIAVADIYDAMTSNKAYRIAESPLVVIEEVFREMFDKLDPHICTVFLKNIKKCLVGQIVRMADGSQAEVADIEEQGFATPMLKTKDGTVLDSAMNVNIVGFMGIKS